MAIKRWDPPKAITKQEAFILSRCRKTRKLFAFLREHRHALFDAAMQQELEAMYRGTGAGREPICPGLMAMALILQGYLGVSDADAVELTVVDLRWQMVLGRLGETAPAFSQGALFHFRERLIASEMDRRLLERTAALARSTKGFDAKKLPKTLRIAIDSSPLSGAGRVEDTINLIGHAARHVAQCVAELITCQYETFCKKAGIPLLIETSVKKALDRDWSDPKQKVDAIDELAKQVLSMERWLSRHLPDVVKEPEVKTLVDTLRQLMEQDLEVDMQRDAIRIARQVAADRRISIEDSEMRHGRKSRSKRIDGYKRHVATDLDSQAILACAVTPANQPEHEALPQLKSDIAAQHIRFREAHFDRGYMGSPTVDLIEQEGAEIVCKPWRPHNTRNEEMFTKKDFDFNLQSLTVSCPAGTVQSMKLGQTIYFDADACDACLLRKQCTSAKKGTGRSIAIADDEPRQEKLRRLSKTKAGRQRFRQRVSVEHRLAHISQRQGNHARYCGVRKNQFDVRRAATIQNLEITQRQMVA